MYKQCTYKNPSADLPATVWLPAGLILARVPSTDLLRSFGRIGMDNIGMAGAWGCKLANGVGGAAKAQILHSPSAGLSAEILPRNCPHPSATLGKLLPRFLFVFVLRGGISWDCR